jgi:hypothetical protein
VHFLLSVGLGLLYWRKRKLVTVLLVGGGCGLGEVGGEVGE